MKTTLRLACAIMMIVCFSLSSFAQRQQALYIDNGSGGFTTITATGGPGTLNLPSSGTLLSSGPSQQIDGLLTLGVNGPTDPIAGELDILDGDGGTPGNDATFLWQSGALNIKFSSYSTSSGAGINMIAQDGFTGGGGITIAAGQAALSGTGGAVGISAGSGQGSTGGQASLAGGGGANASGGEVLVEGGNSSGSTGDGGEALVKGGNGNVSNGGAGGAISLSSGNGGASVSNGGSGGACTLSGGSGANGGTGNGGNGGSVSISGGLPGAAGGFGGPGSPGAVNIQTTAGNTSIGNTGGTIQLSGTVALGGTLALGANGGTAGTLTIWDAASNSVNITYSVGHIQIPSGLNIGSGAGLTNNIASGGGGSENFFGESPITGNATNYFGVSTEFDGTVHNFIGNNGDEGTATNDIEGNSTGAATTIATYNMANNSVSMGNPSSSVTITSGTGATAWSVTSAGAGSFSSVSPTILKGEGTGNNSTYSNKYAEQYRVGASTSGVGTTTITISNSNIGGAGSVVVASLVSSVSVSSLGTVVPGSGTVAITAGNSTWSSGDVVNYIIVNP